MKYASSIIILIIISIMTMNAQNETAPTGFVTVEDTQFKIDGKPYRFVGTNFWYGPQLGLVANRGRLLKELDQMAALGINNLRIMVASEGPTTELYRVQPPLLPKPYQYNEELLEGLDFLLVEMKKRKMYGVLVLGNFWHWSGGFGQYLSWVNDKAIPYPSFNGGLSWGIYMKYVYKFYANPKAKKIYWDVVQTVVTRKNSISNELYVNDPTIMSWQLANEPKCGLRKMAYRNWIRKTARLIKGLDSNHLVSTGSEGIESESLFGNRRRNFIKNHSKYIDYLTVHIWIQNWMWYNPHKPESLQPAQKKAIQYLDKHIEIAKELNMPLVLEEFGIARDKESYEPNSTVEERDSYYRFMFEYVAQNIAKKGPLQACNFWLGEG